MTTDIYKGVVAATIAYISWGVMPIYVHMMKGVPLDHYVAYRVVSSCLFLHFLLTYLKLWSWKAEITRREVLYYAGTALLISSNWLIFIWANANDHTVDASLGYFINPLLFILLGFLILKEHLRPLQWAAVAIAAIGVAWLTWREGRFPWIGIGLALTFGFYGLMKKKGKLGALESLYLETLVLTPFAILYIIYAGAVKGVWYPSFGLRLDILIVLLGPVSAIPLWMYARGARLLPFSIVGVLQFISPTLQLFCGVVLYGEALRPRLPGFVIIWTAIAVFLGENFHYRRVQLRTEKSLELTLGTSSAIVLSSSSSSSPNAPQQEQSLQGSSSPSSSSSQQPQSQSQSHTATTTLPSETDGNKENKLGSTNASGSAAVPAKPAVVRSAVVVEVASDAESESERDVNVV